MLWSHGDTKAAIGSCTRACPSGPSSWGDFSKTVVRKKTNIR